MKHYISVSRMMMALSGFTLLLAGGCVYDQREQQMHMQQQREQSYTMQEDLRRMRSKIESLEQDLAYLTRQINEQNAEQARLFDAQVQALNASMTELQRQIRQVDTAREADKKQVVDTLSAKIASMIQSQPRPRSGGSRPVSGEGYEHRVESGETLSAIAKAYGVSSSSIVQANNLRSADMLYVGQVLFIPAP